MNTDELIEARVAARIKGEAKDLTGVKLEQYVSVLDTVTGAYDEITRKIKKAGGVLLSHGRVPHYPRRWSP